MSDIKNILLSLLLLVSHVAISDEGSPIENTPIEQRIQFSNDLSLNAHIYLVSLAQGARTLPLTLTAYELKQTNDAIEQYRKEVNQNGFHIVRSDSHVATMTSNLYKDTGLDGSACVDSCIALKQFLPVYQNYVWPDQQKINHAWIRNAETKLKHYGIEIEHQLKSAFDTTLIPTTHQIDLVDFIENGATTSGRSPNTLISSTNLEYRDWFALEMVFHEIAHTYASGKASPLRKTIAKTFNKEVLQRHQMIWHAIHFYTVGFVVKAVLSKAEPGYPTYGVQNNVYDRSWSVYLPLIETHWTKYLQGQLSMEKALESIAADLAKN